MWPSDKICLAVLCWSQLEHYNAEQVHTDPGSGCSTLNKAKCSNCLGSCEEMLSV